jgi:membrane associated rhomboid family serine protease
MKNKIKAISLLFFLLYIFTALFFPAINKSYTFHIVAIIIAIPLFILLKADSKKASKN